MDVVWRDVGDGGEVAIEGEAERSADRRDAPDDVGAIDGGGIPGVIRAMDCFVGNFEVAASLVDSDGDGLVKKTEEALDEDGLVVAAEGWFAW